MIATIRRPLIFRVPHKGTMILRNDHLGRLKGFTGVLGFSGLGFSALV